MCIKRLPVIILSQSAVEPCQLPQLHLSQIILILWGLNTLLQDITDLKRTEGANLAISLTNNSKNVIKAGKS